MSLQAVAKRAEMLDTTAEPIKHRRISRRIRDACDAIVAGEVRSVTEAAQRANLSREHLSRELSKPHVLALLNQKTCRALAIGVGRAGAVKLELLDSESDHVRNQASTEVLALAGIRPANQTQVSVNIDLKAGFVIDLREPAPAVTIDHEGVVSD